MWTSRKTFLFGAALGLMIPMTLAAEEGLSAAEKWYRESYAPLWASEPWDKIDVIARHFAATVRAHDADGSVTEVDGHAWLSEAVSGWKADGWVGSELAALETFEQAPSKVMFEARWLDRYRDGETEYSCGSYMVEPVDAGWRITEYGDLDCSPQDAH